MLIFEGISILHYSEVEDVYFCVINISDRTYVPRKVKSGMPLFNRRAEEEDMEPAAAAAANEGASGGVKAAGSLVMVPSLISLRPIY